MEKNGLNEILNDKGQSNGISNCKGQSNGISNCKGCQSISYKQNIFVNVFLMKPQHLEGTYVFKHTI